MENASCSTKLDCSVSCYSVHGMELSKGWFTRTTQA